MISSSHFFKKTFFTLQNDEKKWTKPILSPWIDPKPMPNTQKQKTKNLIKSFRYQKINEQAKLARQQSIYKKYVLNLQNSLQNSQFHSKNQNKKIFENHNRHISKSVFEQKHRQQAHINNTIQYSERSEKKINELLQLKESKISKINHIRRGHNKYNQKSGQLSKNTFQGFQLQGRKTRKFEYLIQK